MRPYVLALMFLAPSLAHGAVLINEIAWMGSEGDANDEWIELYNDGTETVSLEGWAIYAIPTNGGNSQILVQLTGDIVGSDFSVLKSTYGDGDVKDESVNAISYTQRMSNDGLTLTLCRTNVATACPSEDIEDQIAGGTGWKDIGGDNTTKDTAQRTSSGWVTGLAKQGEPNVETGTPPPSGSSGSSGSSSGGSKAKVVPKKVTLPVEREELTLTLTAPSIVYVNQAVLFVLTPEGAGRATRNSLQYQWNFGDTYTSHTQKPTHTYAYPGEYVVYVEARFAESKASLRHDVTVLPVPLSLGRTERGDILLHNNAQYEVDVTGYQLFGETYFTFPPYSIIKPQGTLSISRSRVGAGQATTIFLYDPDRVFVASSRDTSVAAAVPLATASTESPALPPEVVATTENFPSETDMVEIGSQRAAVSDAVNVPARASLEYALLAGSVVAFVAIGVLLYRRERVVQYF